MWVAEICISSGNYAHGNCHFESLDSMVCVSCFFQVVHGHQQSYDAQAADIWSMGVCLFVMTMGAFPFLMVPASRRTASPPHCAGQASAPHCQEFSNYLTTNQLQFPERCKADSVSAGQLSCVNHAAVHQALKPSYTKCLPSSKPTVHPRPP